MNGFDDWSFRLILEFFCEFINFVFLLISFHLIRSFLHINSTDLPVYVYGKVVVMVNKSPSICLEIPLEHIHFVFCLSVACCLHFQLSLVNLKVFLQFPKVITKHLNEFVRLPEKNVSNGFDGKTLLILLGFTNFVVPSSNFSPYR